MEKSDEEITRDRAEPSCATSSASTRRPSRCSAASTAGRSACRSTRWVTSTASRSSRRAAPTIPGLALAGGSYRGVGLPNCIESGEAAVSKVLGDWGITLAEDTVEEKRAVRT